MAFGTFYRYIQKIDDNTYCVTKNNEKFGTYNRLEDALYERDRLIQVGWDWDLWMELPETINGYIHITLPPFNHEPKYISYESEHWVVRDKGKEQKYRGRYHSLEDAKKVALIYDGTISHKRGAYCVRRRIDGVSTYFGRYKTFEEAQERVEELDEKGWNK